MLFEDLREDSLPVHLESSSAIGLATNGGMQLFVGLSALALAEGK
jgi:hypothetical protein